MSSPVPRAMVVACETVIEELAPYLPDGVRSVVLDFGLHTRPGALRERLQELVGAVSDVDVILLGYGLCSRAVIGLRAGPAALVIPRVHDCIGLFLGSQGAYVAQARSEPGTYYLTKGWIAVGDSPSEQMAVIAARYGPERARRMMGLMLRHYRRLAFINTGVARQEEFRDRARAEAGEFGLRFEEIDGDDRLARKLAQGPWDAEFVVIPPGGLVTNDMFTRPGAPVSLPMPGLTRPGTA